MQHCCQAFLTFWNLEYVQLLCSHIRGYATCVVIFQNVRKSMRRHCQNCLKLSGRNFEHLLQYLSIKFSVSLMCCCSCAFSLFICIITRTYSVFYLVFLFDSESSLRLLHLLQVCRSGSETPVKYFQCMCRKIP